MVILGEFWVVVGLVERMRDLIDKPTWEPMGGREWEEWWRKLEKQEKQALWGVEEKKEFGMSLWWPGQIKVVGSRVVGREISKSRGGQMSIK